MDVFATVCLAVTAIAALAIGQALRRIGQDLKETRRLLERILESGDDGEVARVGGASPDGHGRKAWIPADAA